MTRGCVVVPMSMEDLGFTQDSGICRRRQRNRRGSRNQWKRNARYQTDDGLWGKLFTPVDSLSESDSDMEIMLSQSREGDRLPCLDLELTDDESNDSDVEFVDNRRRRRNKRRPQRQRRRQRQAKEEEELILLTEDTSESDAEEEEVDILKEPPADFSSNLQSLKDAGPVINENNDKYEFNLQLAEVTPENITVSLKDQVLTITAKKEEVSEDGSTKLLQEFTKKIILPENVVEKELKSSLSANGVLRIEAPLSTPKPAVPEVKDIPIPIEVEISAT